MEYLSNSSVFVLLKDSYEKMKKEQSTQDKYFLIILISTFLDTFNYVKDFGRLGDRTEIIDSISKYFYFNLID